MLEDAIKYLRSLSGYTTVTEETDSYPSKIIAMSEKSRTESLERFQERPNRIEHTATLVSSGAFIDYVNRFKGPSTSIYLDIFGDYPSFSALLDHHDPKAPSWNKHRAVFAPKVSLEWKAWTALHNGGAIDQAGLVAFMEDHANDLHEPSPAAMLTAVQQFEAVETHKYNSAINLDNGNMQLTYVKDGGQRKVTFPHTLDLYIPMLENEDKVFVQGRLRYKTREGSIAFMFQLKQDPERLMRDAVRALGEEIKELCECHHYEGVSRS